MQLLVGATLVDGTGKQPLSDSAILINEGRIEAVGTRSAVQAPADAEVLDLSGLSLLPGLIDCHDHLASHGYDVARRFGLAEPRSTEHLRTAKVLQQVLASGYTAVRDGGGLDIGFKEAIEEGLIVGPRLVISTSVISPIGGIGERQAPSGQCCTYSPHGDPTIPDGIATGPDQARQKVREVIRAGAEVVKFATTGGASSRRGHEPRDPDFGRDEIEALVQEAKAHGRRTMCHALGGPGLKMAVEAGVTSIEHGTYLDEDPEVIPMMAEKGVFFVPTFTVYSFHAVHGTEWGRRRSAELHDHHRESLRRALAAGVRVVAGTDAGGWGHPHNARELELMVEAGMTPMQAVQAATGVAAACLGMEEEIGTVEAGKLADLVAYDGEPLQDITLLQDPVRLRLVMKGGEPVVNKLAGARTGVAAG